AACAASRTARSRAGVRSSAQEHPLAADPGLQHADLPDVLGRDAEVVAVNHDEVGPLARFQRALTRLLVRGPGGIEGEGAQRFLARHALVGVPAAVGMVLVVLPR